ncbi:hypothetical protein SDC9_197508 [bioreactor metagenome]|uniref:Uncharacterized protein n=1 Tax=bioreactor metagenome TaxID=1076179 RepID=A0A645INH2_9ZZZZ
MRVDIGAHIHDVFRQAACLLLMGGGADAAGHEHRKQSRGLNVVEQVVVSVSVEGDEVFQRAAHGNIRVDIHQRIAAVLGEKELIIRLCGLSVEVHPEDAPCALLGRGAVILRFFAVDPEELPGLDGIDTAVIFEDAFAGNAVLNQVGG